MNKISQLVWSGLAVLLVALAVGAALRLGPLSRPEVVATAPPDAGCDLHRGPCAARLPEGGTIELGIEPRAIPLLQPLQLQVRVMGLAAQSVEVDFRGVDMDMGYNRPRLAQMEEGRFAGKTVLPVCVTDRMTWEALVLVRTDRGIVAAPFRFETARD